MTYTTPPFPAFISKTDLAKQAGISRPTLYKLLKDPLNARFSSLQKVYEALGYRATIKLEPLNKG